MKYTIHFSTLLFLFFGFQSSAQITQGLTGHWPLDDNANDLSGHSHHGSTNGTFTSLKDPNNTPRCVLKLAGRGFQMKGLDSSHFSYSFWMAQTKAYAVLLRRDTALGAYDDFLLSYSYDPKSDSSSIYGSQQSSSTRAKFKLDSGSWVHVVALVTPDSCSIFINGQFRIKKQLTYLGGIKLSVGGSPFAFTRPASQVLYLDEVLLYNRILSPKEIESLYTSYSPCSLVTGLEQEEPSIQEEKPTHAFTLMGIEIPDWENYSGLVIFEYADGKRRKVIRE